MSGERKDCLSWDEYCMLEAIIESMRSKDPRTQVGACIAKDRKILTSGYNRTVAGMTDEEMPWHSRGEETGDLMQIKNTFVVHAELGSIFAGFKGGHDLRGATMYVTLSPCIECTRAIIEAELARVVYLKRYSKLEQVMASKFMLENAGVIVEQFQDITSIDSLEEKVEEKVLSKLKKL